MKAKAISSEDAPAFVCDLLQKRHKWRREDLSARVVAKALGQTTGFLYHHWGSFDRFLFDVSGLGWGRLVDAVVRAYEASDSDPGSILHAYVEFAANNPVLYWLIAERPLSTKIVKATLAGGSTLPSYTAWIRFFELVSHAQPNITLERARAMHAAAHGLASQLLSGRHATTPDTLVKSDRQIAREVGDAIVAALFVPTAATAATTTTASRSPGSRSPARDPKARSLTSRRTKGPRARSSPKASRKRKSGT